MTEEQIKDIEIWTAEQRGKSTDTDFIQALYIIGRLIKDNVELMQEVESVQACYTDSQLNRGL